jgi:23S rRNA pseudouridine955/2504/2580 synthase|tara:strand:+ start:5867 stop:6844 length:978 start_codon:yes stop_codon:yes gene_type:complete
MAKGQDIIVEKDDHDCRLSTWIIRNNKLLSFNSVNTLCRKGLIRVNGLKTKASYRLVAGDTVRMPTPFSKTLDKKPKLKFDPLLEKELIDSVIFKDEYLIAINKPEGLASQGGSYQGDRHIDAYKSIFQFDSNEAPRLIHRLDKDTSGVLLLARNAKAANIFTSLFRQKLVEKVYWALVEGVPRKKEGIVESYIGKLDIWRPNFQKDLDREKSSWNKENTKKALSYYRVIKQVGSQYSWLQLKPATGRTHQLRIHCAELGTTIVGDRKYRNSQSGNFKDSIGSEKLFLHAKSLTFMHPVSKKTTVIEAELPKHMSLAWKRFGWRI